MLQVINTVKPGYFQQEITKALKDRKEKQALSQNKFIEMNEDMLKLITGSNHVSTGKLPFTHPSASEPRESAKSVVENLEKEDATTAGRLVSTG